MAAYPELSCTQKPQFVNTGGVYLKGVQTAYCPGNEAVFTFLQDVLLEVMELFPSKFIHIGGDEVDKTHWKQCERCQQRIQAGPEGEPFAFGGMNTLKNVYDYEPVPGDLNQEQGKLVLGAQANLWTEFITSVEQLEYMVLPRMLALAEVVWSPAENRDWLGFNYRLQAWHFPAFRDKGLRYHPGNNRVAITPVSKEGRITVELTTEIVGADIYYTTDGSFPGLNGIKYTGPFQVNQSMILQAFTVKDGSVMGVVPARQDFSVHKASGLTVKYQTAPSPNYCANGLDALTDGVRGTLIVGKFWHGFSGSDVVAQIDLGSEMEVSSFTLGALQKQVDWIFPPRQVEFSISNDGESFTSVAVVTLPLTDGDNQAQTLEYKATVNSVKARYVKVIAKNYGNCPKGHPGEGQPSWVFVDEFIVE